MDLVHVGVRCLRIEAPQTCETCHKESALFGWVGGGKYFCLYGGVEKNRETTAETVWRDISFGSPLDCVFCGCSSFPLQETCVWYHTLPSDSALMCFVCCIWCFQEPRFHGTWNARRAKSLGHISGPVALSLGLDLKSSRAPS